MYARAIGVLIFLLLAVTGNPGAQVLRQMTEEPTTDRGNFAIDDAGTVLFLNTNSDPFGNNAAGRWQLAGWDPATGIGSFATSDPDGVAWDNAVVSVSDDGQWVAFASPANLVGQNADESVEIYVMHPDGSNLSQITDQPGTESGSLVYELVLAGSGGRIAFLANTDPLGTNPDRDKQLFAIDRDGTNLQQLTSDPEALPYRISIDDAGVAIVFTSRADLTGANPGLQPAVFSILDDGTNLRQIAPGLSVQISGDSKWISLVLDDFPPQGKIVSSQDGSLKLAVGGAAFLSDDASVIVFSDDQVDAVQNPEGNLEVWRIGLDGSGLTALTQSVDDESTALAVSGSGTHVPFAVVDPSDVETLKVMDANGANVFPLSSFPSDYRVVPGGPDITPDGTRIVFSRGDVYRIQSDGSDLFALTDLGVETINEPTITADGNTIVFDSATDPLGTNPTFARQVFAVEADGTGLRQLSFASSAGVASPHVASDGSVVVFQGYSAAELWRVQTDGTGLAQLTTDGNFLFKWPRVDASGTWVVFQSQSNALGNNPNNEIQIFRVRTDGTGYEAITSYPHFPSGFPDISGSGDRIVYTSLADPVGSNPENNAEIFLYQASTGTTVQLTDTVDGYAREPRISQDGSTVYFHNDASVFEANSGRRFEPYRIDLATGAIERAGGQLRVPSALLSGYSFRYRYYHVAVDGTGDRAVFSAPGDWVNENPDYDWELYQVDQTAAPRIEPGKPAPTVVTWKPEPRLRRYDVIRGDVANLGLSGSTVDLGPVVCIEDNSPDRDTAGNVDVLQPAPGQVLFYLYRGTQGNLDGPGSWGEGTGGLEREPAVGACPG